MTEIRSELISVAGFTVTRKGGKTILNITDDEDREFGTVKDEIIEAVQPLADCQRLVLDYTVEKNGKWTNRYIVGAREATNDDLEPAADAAQADASWAPQQPTVRSPVDVTVEAAKLAAELMVSLSIEHIDVEENVPITHDRRATFVRLIPALRSVFLSGASDRSLEVLAQALGVKLPGTGIIEWPGEDTEYEEAVLAEARRQASEAVARRARNAEAAKDVA